MGLASIAEDSTLCEVLWTHEIIESSELLRC